MAAPRTQAAAARERREPERAITADPLDVQAIRGEESYDTFAQFIGAPGRAGVALYRNTTEGDQRGHVLAAH